MTSISVGDMARSYYLRRHHEQVKSDLSTLTAELASGQHADLGKALGGDFTALAGITRGIRMYDAYAEATAEAALAAATAQSALQSVQTTLEDMGTALLGTTGTGTYQQMELTAASGRERLSTMVSALNQSITGRSLFSGTASDRPALIPVDNLMQELATVAAGSVDAADLIARLDSWFMDAGGGYETIAYQGSGTAPGFAVAEGEVVDNPATALDPGLRRSLMGMAMTALVADGLVTLGEEDRRLVLEQAATDMVTGNEGVIALQASLGRAEEQIDAARLRQDTARSALEIERGRIMAADPYETATRLQDAQTRLESLYLLTTRLSNLSLTEFMR